jgi:hypothetical protein
MTTERQGSFETDLGDEDLTEAINVFAQHEGWGIFNGTELQRDDELNIFANDDDALAFVKRLADAGSVLHQHAIELTQENLS